MGSRVEAGAWASSLEIGPRRHPPTYPPMRFIAAWVTRAQARTHPRSQAQARQEEQASVHRAWASQRGGGRPRRPTCRRRRRCRQGAGIVEGGAPGTTSTPTAATAPPPPPRSSSAPPPRPPSRADALRGHAAVLRAPLSCPGPGRGGGPPKQPGHHARGRRWRQRGRARDHPDGEPLLQEEVRAG